MPATIHPDARVALLSVTASRPPNSPRLVIFHTNAGGSSSDGVATRRWIEAQLAIKKTPTQPHHQVDLDGTIWQFLPYDRKGVASAAAEGFCISVETQDYGTAGGWSIELQPWTDEQIESLASIAAFAHVEYGIPLRRPAAWDETGIGTHSMWGVNTASDMTINPWTTVAGKTCPGAARKAQLDRIIARARELVAPTEEDDVKYIYIGADGRPGAIFALDGSGASFLGAASPDDAEKLIAAYNAPLVPVSVAQYDEMVNCSRKRGVA